MANSKLKRILALLGTVAAMAMPAAAVAKKGPGKGVSGGGEAAERGAKPKKPKKPKTSTYVFTGTVSAVGTVTVQVEVKGGNSRGRRHVGQTLTFSLDGAKLKLRDANADGKRDMADVAVGDRVAIQAKLPRGDLDVSAELPARHFLDKGPLKPKAENAEEDQTQPAPAG
jgi:hypothetical protein